MKEGRQKEEFELSVQGVFHSLNVLMSNGSERTKPLQCAVLRTLPSVIPHIITVYKPHEFRCANRCIIDIAHKQCSSCVSISWWSVGQPTIQTQWSSSETGGPQIDKLRVKLQLTPVTRTAISSWLPVRPKIWQSWAFG